MINSNLSPPSYLSLQELNNSHLNDHQHIYLNLPSGYFLIQSKSSKNNNLVLDIKSGKNLDGTEICLHSQKDPILNRSNSLRNNSNNQVFFLNWSGHLCSASSPGFYVDATLNSNLNSSINSKNLNSSTSSTTTSNSNNYNTSSLQLLSPQPLFSIPSRTSHPPPQFSLDPDTQTLHVLFGCDPNFPGPKVDSREWMETEYILESVPRRKRKVVKDPERTTEGWNFGDIATSQAATNAVGLLSTFGWGKRLSVAASSAIASHTQSHTHIYPHSTIIEESDDDDSDSEPDAYRSIRLVSLPIGWRQTLPSSITNSPIISSSSNNSPQNKRLWSRRQFKILPISVEITPPPPSSSSMMTTNPNPINPFPPTNYSPSSFSSPVNTLNSNFSSPTSPTLNSRRRSIISSSPAHTVAQSSPFVLEFPDSPRTSLLAPSPSSNYSNSSPTNHFSPSLPPRLSSSSEAEEDLSSSSSPEFDSPIPTTSDSPLPSLPSSLPTSSTILPSSASTTSSSSNFYTLVSQAASTLSHNALSAVQQAALSSSTSSSTSSTSLANKRTSGGGPKPLTLSGKVSPASPTKLRSTGNGDDDTFVNGTEDKVTGETETGGEKFGLGLGTLGTNLVRRISLGSSTSILPPVGSSGSAGSRSNRSSISSGFSSSNSHSNPSSSATSATTTFSGSIGIGRRSRIPSSTSSSTTSKDGTGYAPHNNPGPNKRDSLTSTTSTSTSTSFNGTSNASNSDSPTLPSSIESSQTSPEIEEGVEHDEREEQEEEEQEEEEEERRGSPRDRFNELSLRNRDRVLQEEHEQEEEEEEEFETSTLTKKKSLEHEIFNTQEVKEREKIGLLNEEQEEEEVEVPGQAL